MLSTHPLISKSSSLIINPLFTVPRTTVVTGITIIFLLHSFFSSLARWLYLTFFSVSFQFYSVANWDSKLHNSASSLFLLIIIRSGHLAEIRWSICISKSQRISCISFFRTDSGLCIYHLFIWSNFSFLHNSLWIPLLTLSYLVLKFFSANLLYLTLGK